MHELPNIEIRDVGQRACAEIAEVIIMAHFYQST